MTEKKRRDWTARDFDHLEFRIRCIEVILQNVLAVMATKSQLVRAPLEDMLATTKALSTQNDPQSEEEYRRLMVSAGVTAMIEAIDQQMVEELGGKPLAPRPTFSVVPRSSDD
ncbi:hypothetical protein ACFSDD_21025 [Salipiger marinus]|uniref:hypothetical protein n=1 Tax=Salipiger marinus TaxID=555512 RepID=UPI002B909F14|nr:hypothetical protein [Salipiger manganoxidans]MEB3417546.1 hypothetical protein [Salipiger manganoxidans]